MRKRIFFLSFPGLLNNIT